MTLPATIQAALERSDFDAVEDAWLELLEQPAGDVGPFAEVGTALDRVGERDRARFLLEMLDEQLRESERWRERLDLLRQAGSILYDEIHPQIIDTVGRLWGGSPSFEAMVDKVGLHRAIDDLPKIWKKVERLGELLGYDEGSIVFMEGKGVGRVVEVNMALESFKVELEHLGSLRVGFGGAAKLLRPLAPEHFLRRKLEEPEVLEKLRDGEPAELLRAVLESFAEPLTGAEIRRHLAGLVDDAGWNAWWTAARKHPQVLAAPGGRKAYTWAASSGHAQDAVWNAFEAADPRGRIDLLRQNAARDKSLEQRMSEALAVTAAEAADPGLACEIWYGLERWGTLPGEVPWAPETLVENPATDLKGLFAGIRDRALRERTYETVRARRDDWKEVFLFQLWQEPDPRALDVLAAALAGDDAFGAFVDQLLSQPRKSPAAFVWFAERAAENDVWRARNPLRLLKQILWSLTHQDFASLRGRLEPLADSGGTLPRLLQHLDEEQAAQAAAALDKAHGLADYQRRPLVTALELRFPDLREDVEQPLYATPEAITRKREELRQLTDQEIPANRRAIEEAREMGDLRENFEYKSARERHEYLSARAAALNHDLSRVRPIEPSSIDGQEVVIGSRVKLAGDGERVLTILGPWDSRPEDDVLSNESELASGLIGRRPGDQVEVLGRSYTIAAVEPYK